MIMSKIFRYWLQYNLQPKPQCIEIYPNCPSVVKKDRFGSVAIV